MLQEGIHGQRLNLLDSNQRDFSDVIMCSLLSNSWNRLEQIR